MIDPKFPLVDLHRHLDGSVRLETIVDLGRKHNLSLPSFEIEKLRPYVQITEPRPGVMAFLEKFEWMVGVLVDYDACRRIAYESVEDASLEGLDYVELRFSPWFMAEPHKLDPVGVVEAVVDGVDEARKNIDVKVNLIGIISRTYGTDIGWQELEALLSKRDSLKGLDLAGDEANFPGNLFVEHFRKGRDAGWEITVHAGESAGPKSVWQALNELGAKRIGHAVAIDDDPTLVEHMLENKIGIESNLTSNVQTSTVEGLAVHPLKRWLEEGLLASINTDDPGISGIDLKYEYEVAASKAGLSEDLIRLAQRNGLVTAFLSDEEKKALIQKKQP